jgi:glutathione peroxidase
MIKLLAITILLSSCNAQSRQNNNNMENKKDSNISSFYDFKVTALDGSTIEFASFKGKKILIVNTASQCGYTNQYEGLEELYKNHKDKLVIVGFPTNDFGNQEPGNNAEIQNFCKKNYGVSFPMAAKITVKGNDMAPIYKWLTTKELNGAMDATISWNFNKFLLDEHGKIIAKFESSTTPLSEDIISKL